MGFRVLIDNAAHHHIDNVVFRTVLRDQRSHISAVPHHCHPVRDHLDLVHAVRNIDNAKLLLAQITDDLEQLVDFGFRQRCRGFIEDNHLRLVGNRLCDLAHLLLAYRQVSHLLGGVNLDMQPLK